MSRPGFPLSAIVGGDELALALVLCALDPAIGGVLLRGEKGSAKSTAARALAALLPGAAPFVELPLGATEERVVGSLDLGAALGEAGLRFAPGLLAAADGGVLYVDEVNLLPDHLVDVLLDAAAGGVNRVERDGVSHVHSSRFVLVGSMNPEEGDLRPQLLDRFGLAVDVRAPALPPLRAEAVRRRLAFDRDPEGFVDDWARSEQLLADRVASTAPAPLAPGLEEEVARLCVGAGAEGLRADLTICRAAAALAGWEADVRADVRHVRRVAPLVLAHRRSTPLGQALGTGQDLVELIEGILGPPGSDDRSPVGSGPGAGPGGVAGRSEPPDSHAEGEPSAPSAPSAGAGPPEPPERPAGAGTPVPGSTGSREREGDHNCDHEGDHNGAGTGGADAGAERPGALDAPPPAAWVGPDPRRGGRPPDTASVGRHRSDARGRSGRTIGARAPVATGDASISVTATLTAAATRWGLDPAVDRQVSGEDLREAVHAHRVGRLVVLAVDTSGSMGASERVEAAKGAITNLLVDAYQRRDRVALVTFHGRVAEVVLRPTASVEVARARLDSLGIGGTTPLAAGITEALGVALAARTTYRPQLVVVSDGRATWAPDGEDPLGAAGRAAASVRRAGIDSLVVDCERGRARLGLAATLADALGAQLVASDGSALTPDRLAASVRGAWLG
ncbi:MAG TPA: VWA domain-containing protein [Acidimicrobiales bacterium]